MVEFSACNSQPLKWKTVRMGMNWTSLLGDMEGDIMSCGCVHYCVGGDIWEDIEDGKVLSRGLSSKTHRSDRRHCGESTLDMQASDAVSKPLAVHFHHQIKMSEEISSQDGSLNDHNDEHSLKRATKGELQDERTTSETSYGG